MVVENAVAGMWERLGLDEAALRAVNPGLVYARAKGFGSVGPLAARPSFDYVVQAATGMEMTQGGGSAPVAGELGGQRLLDRDAAGGRGRAVRCWVGPAGAGVTTVEGSLTVTATLYQVRGRGPVGGRRGGAATGWAGCLWGPSVGRRLYRAKDGWVVVCCVTASARGAAGCGARCCGG